jgi:hypothetical protein
MHWRIAVKIPVFILVWMGFIAIKLPTALAGLFMVPIIFPYRGVNYDDLPWWTKPWANPEDWTGGPEGVPGRSLPQWWLDRMGNTYWAFYKYHAIRNPANGLRSYEWLDVDPDPELIGYWTPRYLRHYEPWHVRKNVPTLKTYGYLAWQGWKAGCKLVHHWSADRHFVLKLGWRIEPRDTKEPIDPDGIRHEDAGFASKLIPYRKG